MGDMGRNNPMCLFPLGLEAETLSTAHKLLFRCPFDPRDSLHSYPRSYFQMRHCVCSLIKSLHSDT